LAVIFLFLAFKSRRHFPLFFIVTFSLVVDFSVSFFSWPERWLNNFKKSRIIKGYFLAGLLIIITSYFVKTNFTESPFTSPLYCQSYPCQAINFIKNNPVYSQLKIFNNYGWGGYIIYTWPGKKLFVDGRFPQYPFRGHTIVEEYLDFFNKDKAAGMLNDYDISLVLIKRPEKIELARWEEFLLGIKQDELNTKAEQNNLQEYLEKSSNWKMVYSDEISYVFAKTN
jgi:hypothetical protein